MTREMKDSGIEWIGEIPEEWEINRIKYLFVAGKGLSITKDNLIDEGLPVISYGQIHSKNNTGIDIQTNLLRFVDDIYSKCYPQCEVMRNDFVFADTSEDYDGCGNCVLKRDTTKLFAGYHTIILHSILDRDNSFLAYLFKTDTWRKQIRQKVSGVKVLSISQKILMNCGIILPPQKEQKAIADYLDAKCSDIDAIANDIQKEISVLEDYKKIIITEVVTKGLDQNVEMKDSGIEWIGKIPKHWDISKLKFLAKESPDFTALDSTIEISYLPMECLKKGYMLPKISTLENLPTGLTRFNEGDIVIAKVTPCFENGNIAIAEKLCNLTGVGSSELYVIRCYKIETKFLFYYLQNANFMKRAISEMSGTGGLKRIPSKFIRNLYITLPNKEEQYKIASYLDAKCSEIDTLIADKKKQLEILADYKKSLIYEYVTGKKEVPTA